MEPRPPRITSSRNERVRQVRALVADAAERRARGACVLEGVRPAREYVAACGPIVLALVSPRLLALDGGPELDAALREALASRPADLVDTTDGVLEAAADTRAPQGVLLVVPTPRHAGLPEPDERPLLVVWEMQEPGNVGSLVRTAEGAGCAAAVIARSPDGAAADPFSPRAVRAAAGSTFRLPLFEWSGEPQALARELRDAGWRLAACVAKGGEAPGRLDLSGPVAIVVGSETRGLPEELCSSPALRITIPLAGAAESLNAGAAAAVVAFEAARQRR